MSLARLQSQIERLELAQSRFEELVIDQVRKFEPEIIELNTEDQLDRGVRGTSRKIFPKYQPLTIKIKRAKGQPTDRVTLKDTGEWYSRFYLNYGKTAFSIENDDELTGPLQDKYGEAILGLTDANVGEVRDLIIDDFTEALQTLIYL